MRKSRRPLPTQPNLEIPVTPYCLVKKMVFHYSQLTPYKDIAVPTQDGSKERRRPTLDPSQLQGSTNTVGNNFQGVKRKVREIGRFLV